MEASCDTTDLAKNLRFAFDYVLPICYQVICISGHSILLVGFHKRAKTDDGYSYQTLLTASKICEIFFITFCLLSVTMGGLSNGDGILAFMRVYILQFYTAHFSLPLGSIFTTNTLLLTVSLAMERVLAVVWPLIHKNTNQKLHRRCAVAVSLLLSIFFNFCDIWQMELVAMQHLNVTNSSLDYYILQIDQDGLSYSTFGIAIGHIRMLFKIVAILILVISNGILVLALRRRTKKLQEISSADQDEQRMRIRADRALLLLTICQSCFALMHQIPMIIYSLIALTAPEMMVCYNGAVIPFIDASVQIADIIDFLVLITVNRKVRKMFLDTLHLKYLWGRITRSGKMAGKQGAANDVKVEKRNAWA